MKRSRSNPSVSAASRRRSTRRRGIRRSFLVSLLLAVGVVTLAAGSTLISNKIPRAQAAPPTTQDAATGDDRISANVLRQMDALAAEKKARNPVQRRLDSQLIYALKMARGEAVAAGVETLSVNLPEGEAGRIVVDITATVNASLTKALESNGAKILFSSPRYNSVRAEVALDRVEAIAATSGVRFIQPKQQALTHRRADLAGGETTPTTKAATFDKGAVTRDSFAARAARVRSQLTKALAARNAQDDVAVDPGAGTNVGRAQSEGDVTHRANTARGTFNTDGTGIRIGVLSDGVVNVAAAKASGDVPQDLVILPGQAGEGDEGTAMLEIVHDLAPGAQLYFATAFVSIPGFAQNIRDLREAGCDIIVDDIFYFVETPFQDGQAPGVVSNTNGGAIMQAVNDVTADGALYFSSAGNEGNKNDNTSGVWEGDFVPGGTNATIGGASSGIVHDFDPGAGVAQTNLITSFGGVNAVSLFWSEPLGGATSDYDLYVLNNAGTTIVGASTNGQDGTQDPVELSGGNAANNRVVVALFSGVPRFLHVNSIRSRFQFNTPGQTKGHSSAAEAYSVAATPANAPFGAPPNPVGPFPAPFNSSNTVELFSSDGPRRIFYRPDGTPYTPGNTTSTGGIVRQKPDITAADGVDITGAGGFPDPFYGTSAAAPHAAAIAALIKSALPNLTPAQIRTALTSSAIDIEAPGVDRDSGAGIVMAYQALEAAGAEGTANVEINATSVAEASGNGNGFVEPGERGTLNIQLRNTGTDPALNIVATLVANTPGVIVTQGSSTYPDLPAMTGTGGNNTAFQFVISGDVSCPSTISFTLFINYSGGPSPKALPFTVTVSQSVTVNTTLDATPPPNGAVYTATTGLQTGRLVRVGAPSSCGTIKSNPGINGADANVPHRYDAYTFQNNTSSPICVTITLTTANTAAATQALQSVAYAPVFNPAQIDQNYLGDIAFNTGAASRTYSVDVPANTSFVIVVNEITGGGGVGTPYTLTVNGLPCSPAPTVNQPPVNNVPGPQTTNENTTLVFSSANGNQISISDPDAGNGPVKVTLTTVGGGVALNGSTGLIFDGTASPNTLTVTGTISDINNALNGLAFLPSPGFDGTASLTITTNDQGLTGSGGAKSDTDVIQINVVDLVTVEFGSASFSVVEAQTAVTLSLIRTGDASVPVSVEYATLDGSAVQRSDYTFTIDRVNFAAGETSKTFTVLINEDSFVEPDEEFIVALTNRSGNVAAVGAQSIATVRIIDDSSEPSTNPIDDSTVFVTQQYHDFLNRTPDAAGLAFWVNNIESCGTNTACRQARREDTSAAFFLSIEFQQTGFLVHKTYQAAFARPNVPVTYGEFIRDANIIRKDFIVGQPGFEQQLEANKQAFFNEFVMRPEFVARYPESTSGQTYVDTLFANAGVTPTQQERTAAFNAFGNGGQAGRARALRSVAESNSVSTRQFNPSFVLMQYFGYLRRDPNAAPDSDFTGYNFWLNKLNQFNGDFRRAEMVKAFINSSEYRSRFGQP